MYIRPSQLSPNLVANVQPLRSLCQQSVNVRLHDTNKRSLGSNSGDDSVESFADAMAHGHGGQPLRHFPLHFSRGIAFLRAVSGDAGEIVVVIWPGLSIEQTFDQPLCDHIGKAPVGRGRVRVILHRQSEVPLRGIARTLQHIFPGPISLMTARERSAK